MHPAEQDWVDLCNKQRWDERAQIILLEGYIREAGLWPMFSRFAAQVASESNKEVLK